jgi:hypothetical protein
MLAKFLVRLRRTAAPVGHERKPLRWLPPAVEALEDRTVPTAIPVTGPNGGAWVKIDTITVSSRTHQTAATGVQSNVVLDAGVPYLAVASGTARIANDGTGFTDAEFIRYNKASGPQDGSSPGYAWNNHGVRLNGIADGNTTGNFWGAYQSDHTYVATVLGQGTLLRGWYSDIPGYYGDNSGTLQVDIYAEIGSGPGSIGGVVWQDELPDVVRSTNLDGIRQSDEPLLAGLSVDLLDQTGRVVANTTTNTNGEYTFGGLPIAAYAVSVNAPAGIGFTFPKQGSDDGVDSDVGDLGVTSPIFLTAAFPGNQQVGGGLAAPPPVNPSALTRSQECLLAVIHGGIDNLTIDEFDQLRKKVTIDDQVNLKLTVDSITDLFKQANTIPQGQAAIGITVATVSLQQAGAITLAPVLTGGGIQILGNAKGALQGQFMNAFTPKGEIGDVGEFALLGHELQHTVQIVRDGSKDGSTFLSGYLKDFADQFQLRVTAAVKANPGQVPDFAAARRDAYLGIMKEIEADALQSAIQNIFTIQANQTKFNTICATVYDPKVGLKSLAGNQDVADLRADLMKEFNKELAAQTKSKRAK